jgi:TonB family protein
MTWLVLALVLLQTGGTSFTPARLVEATAPAQPPNAPGGGEVVLGVTVSEAGRVSAIRTLRAAPPFTELVVQAIEQWRFTSATVSASGDAPRAIASDVLVAALFRPPALYDLPGDTPAEGVGAVPAASSAMPYPTRLVSPAYPPKAVFDGVVVVEVSVTAQGDVSDASVLGGGSGFAGAALAAARQWRFRPAIRDGRQIDSYAYLIFGFRQPVTVSPR